MAQRLGELDEVLQGRSTYKSEVSHDMTKNPPRPILDNQTGSAHGWVPGWIKKHWDEDPEHPPFKPGRGMIRRPDVVIVNDPQKPPTQDNIKQVVEMKFPPDPPDDKQIQAYQKLQETIKRSLKWNPPIVTAARRTSDPRCPKSSWVGQQPLPVA